MRREDSLNYRDQNLTDKEKKLDEKLKKAEDKSLQLDKMEADLQSRIDGQIALLERVSNMSKEEADGKEWIVKERMKTGVPSFIPLMEVAKEILVKYDYVLPVLSNQKYNSYLKEIQDICHITKNLHSHLARHTYGTLLLNAGLIF